MPVPKKRRSKSKSRIKKAYWKLEKPKLRPCPQCGAQARSHFACPTCGTYKGRQIIQIKDKSVKAKDED